MSLDSLVDLMNNTINYGTLAYTLYSLGKSALCKWKTTHRSRSLRTLLGNKNITVHIPSRKLDRLKPVVAMEDYNTYEKLREVLLVNGFNVSLKYINSEGIIEPEHDNANIVVCGPKNSPIVKEMFISLKSPTFRESDKGWTLRLGKEILTSPLEDSYAQHAFLGKINLNIPNYTEPILLICGVHAIGSDGVAYYLGDNKVLDALLNKVGENLFHCVITSSYSKDSKQIYAANLHEGSLYVKGE